MKLNSLLSCEAKKKMEAVGDHTVAPFDIMLHEIRFAQCPCYETAATTAKGNLLAPALLLTIHYVAWQGVSLL